MNERVRERYIKCVSVSVCGVESVCVCACVCVYMSPPLPSLFPPLPSFFSTYPLFPLPPPLPSIISLPSLHIPLLLPHPPHFCHLLLLPLIHPPPLPSPPLNSPLCTLRCPPWQVTHSSPISSHTSRPCKQPAKRKMPPKQRRWVRQISPSTACDMLFFCFHTVWFLCVCAICLSVLIFYASVNLQSRLWKRRLLYFNLWIPWIICTLFLKLVSDYLMYIVH